jgi:hypothetical protein
MNEKNQKSKSRVSVRLDLRSRFWKTFLIVLAAVLTFAGPTYVVYALTRILKIGYAVSMISGFALFVAGLVLVWYLIKNKVIS